MPDITLQTFASGDTNYISKHNANYSTIAAAINSIQTQLGVQSGTGNSQSAGFQAMFGTANAVIGADSYKATGSGTDLTVQSGFVWIPSTNTLATKATSTVLSFSGLAAATYYVVVGSDGEPTRSDSATNAAYSVVWDGGAFGTITLLMNIAWGYIDFNAAKTSAVLGATYNKLDDRLEAAESASTAMLSKTVAGTNITLTTAEAMEHFAVKLTGAQSADIDLIVPNTEKPYYVINDCTGGFSVTIKTAAGTGVTVNNGERAVAYCDATNVEPMTTSGGEPYVCGGMYNGLLPANIVLYRLPLTHAVTFPAGMTGSYGTAGTAATAETNIDLLKNGVSFGTMRFNAAADTANFIAATETSFAAGDVLTMIGPATPDVSLAGLGWTLKGTR